MSEWQPIETAPKDGRVVLVFDDAFEEPIFSLHTFESVISDFGQFSNSYDPTHWMPLPDPPNPSP